MANILNIDTSSQICSVALSQNGEVVKGLESANKMDHSISLAPFIEQCLEYVNRHGIKLDAVSVTAGPGSYTGLRIGMSMAKGLAYGFGLPLITLSSLEVMAVRAIFSYSEFSGEELIMPMIDARRMEVFTGVFDSRLNKEIEESPLILDQYSFDSLKDVKKILIIGNGSEKFKTIYKYNNAEWLGSGMPHAKYMTVLSEKYFREEKFSDVAYSVPSYLKAYQATKPKSRI